MFSLVMAVYDDFHGVYFTIQSALMYHGQYINEIIIVDNNPDSPHGKMTRGFASGMPKVRYEPYTAKKGTAATRDLAIRLATSEYVICCDPHVLFPPGSIEALADYCYPRDEKGQRWLHHHLDIISGPLLYDDHVSVSTHFNLDVWRGQMWGIWDTNVEGYKSGKPFEIPAQGLGVFCVRRESWLGFHPDFEGFGGEEGYIHEKYRKAGRKAICIPQFLWMHRFGRPDGVPYPLTKYSKVRNYIIGHRELGLDLTNAHNHFVGERHLSQAEWDQLLISPSVDMKGCGCAGDRFKDLEDWVTYAQNQPTDINEHVHTLRMYAGGRNVVDFGYRVGVSGVGLLAGTVAGKTNYTLLYPSQPLEWPHFLKYTNGLAKFEIFNNDDALGVTGKIIPKCDLLFLDMTHTYEFVYRFLNRNHEQVKDFILIHDTISFGERGEDGNKGVMYAIRDFVRHNRRWSVSEHMKNNNGLIVLCGNDAFKPELPSKLRQASNFTKALLKHVANGNEQVDSERLELRLIQCDMCPSRVNDRCGECGCPIDKKASWAKEECPLGKW